MQEKSKKTKRTVTKQQKARKIAVKENPKTTILKKAPEEVLAMVIREMMKK